MFILYIIFVQIENIKALPFLFHYDFSKKRVYCGCVFVTQLNSNHKRNKIKI